MRVRVSKGRVKERFVGHLTAAVWSAAAGLTGWLLYEWAGVPAGAAFACAAALTAAGWIGMLTLWESRLRRAVKKLPDRLQSSLYPLPTWTLGAELCGELDEYYHSHLRFAARQLIENLLNDNSHTAGLEGVSEKLDTILESEVIDFHWKLFCIVYVVVDDYSAYLLKDRIDRPGGGIHLEDYRRMYETVMESFVERFNVRHRCHCVEYGKNCVCIINLRETRADSTRTELEPVMDELEEAAGEVVRSMYERYGVTLEVAISAPYQDVMESHDTCEWLESQLKYSRFIQRRAPVITERDILVATPVCRQEITAMEKRYITCLLSQNYEGAEQALYQLIDRQAAQTPCNINRLLDGVALRLGQLQRLWPEGENNADLSAGIEAVSGADDLEELKARIGKVFRMSRNMQTETAEGHNGTAWDIRDYINENYRNPEMSNGLLADYFSLSQSYISRVFNREIGVNLPDYIHGLRIGEAKRLLAETDLSISDISVKVGYTTAWTMNRAFKRYENLTPGAYRQLCREPESCLSGSSLAK